VDGKPLQDVEVSLKSLKVKTDAQGIATFATTANNVKISAKLGNVFSRAIH
jgi:hypothetical protein